MRGVRARTLSLSVVGALMLGTLGTAGVGAADPSGEPGPVEISYWSLWNDGEAQATVIKDAIAAFEADHPGMTVKVQWNGRGNGDLISAALAAGQQIDVFDLSAGAMSTIHGSELLPLDAYLDTPAVGEPGATFRETVSPALLNLFPVDGQVVSIPYQPYVVAYFYNKDHFDQAGITSVPTTWDEFMAANAKLKAAGFAPVTTDFDGYLDINFAYHAMRETGSCDLPESAMLDKTGELWRDPAFLRMAQDIAMLSANGYLADGTDGNLYPAGQQRVALGEVSQELNATWLPGELASTAGPDFRWGAFAYPTVTGGTGTQGDSFLGSQNLGIPKASTHPDETFEFIKYLMAPDAQTGFVNEASAAPANLSVAWPASLADAEQVFKDTTNGYGWACLLYVGPAADLWTQVVLPAFGDLYSGKVTPEAYIDRMVTESAAFWAGS